MVDEKTLSQDLRNYINFALTQKIYYPALAISAIMDFIFSSENWWEFEYETILEELERLGLAKPNNNILGEIQCLSAIRGGKSFVDQEWHLFEKTCAALTGIPVLFYEKQNLPIENVVHAMRIMEKLTKVEYSEEVQHYIGCEAINDELFWHPSEEVDDYLMKALERMKTVLGLDMNHINDIRERVKAKFAEYSGQELAKIDFKDNSVEDQMCKRLFVSMVNSHDLITKEKEALDTFSNVKEGLVHFTQTGESSEAVAKEDINAGMLAPVSDAMDIEMPDEDYGPLAFTEGVKEAMLTVQEKVAGFMMNNMFDEMEAAMGIFQPVSFVAHTAKVASIPGSPIMTGVSVGGIFPEEKSEHFELESTEPHEGSAVEIMQEVADTELSDAPDVMAIEEEDDYNPFMG